MSGKEKQKFCCAVFKIKYFKTHTKAAENPLALGCFLISAAGRDQSDQ